jgi:O-antigen ligase
VWVVVDRRVGAWFLEAIALAIAGLLAAGLGARALSGVPVDPYYGGLLAEPVGYPNAIGVLAAMGALLAITLAAAVGRRRRVLHGAAALQILALGLSGSRGGAIALLVGLCVLLGLSARDARWTCVGRAASALVVGGGAWAITLMAGGGGAPLVIAAVGAAVVGAAVPTPGRRASVVLLCGLVLAALLFAAQHPPSATSSYRTAYWQAALAEMRERPLLGSGAGSFFLSWQEHRTIEANVRDAHSLYVETLSELGPVGLALVIVAFGAPLVVAVRGRGDPLLAGAGAAFAVFVLHAGLDWDWEMPVVTVVGLACAGVALGAGIGRGAP